MSVIDMQTMRYINLLDSVSRVKTRRCFVYHGKLFFAVNKNLVSKAIGAAASNIKTLQEKIGKKIKIIREPSGEEDIQRFIEDIVFPVKMKSVEIKDGIVVITGGSNQNKASLIGRNKRRYDELRKIVHDFFGFDLKIL